MTGDECATPPVHIEDFHQACLTLTRPSLARQMAAGQTAGSDASVSCVLMDSDDGNL